MKMANQTIEITVEEYKHLVQGSTQLNLIKNYFANREYVSQCEIATLLGVKKNGTPDEE